MRGAAATAAFGLLLLPGCITSTQATRLQKDLDDVKRQIFQVQQETAGSRAQIEELARGLSPGGAPAAQADLQAAIQSLLDQIQALSERMAEISAQMAALVQEIRPPQPGGPRGGAPPFVESPSGTSGGPADQTFKAAYADYSKGNYELAVMGFREFLRANPAHPLAPEAQYWIGECLYSQGKYEDAVEALDRALEKYPPGEKMAPALLKKGYSQIEAGRTSQAVATLQKLIQEHPQSNEARLASERLKQLGLRAR